jgi:serine/threonine protein kinase
MSVFAVPPIDETELIRPLDFPDAVINPGGLKGTQIVADRRVQIKLCLYSPSGTVYEIDRKISDCIFGQVHIGIVLQPTQQHNIYSRTSRRIAVKIILKRKMAELGPKCTEDPMKEIAAQQFVGNDHPNVMGLIECISDANNYYSLMDFAEGGELFDNVKMNGRCAEDTARRYFSQILDGLEYLHSLGIYHRDMSLENLMLTRDGVCKIIDFGMCLRFPMDAHGNFCAISQVPPCGKKAYLPPEIYMQSPATFDGSAADVWSLGTILCMMLIGGPIFSVPAIICKLYRRFFQGEFRAMLEKWKIALSADATDLIERILRIKPEERPCLAEIRQHPWLS